MTQKLTPAALFIEDYELLTWMKDNNIIGDLMCELTDEILDCISELTYEVIELESNLILSTNCEFDIKITKMISDDSYGHIKNNKKERIQNEINKNQSN